jgi:hypothetical protein
MWVLNGGPAANDCPIFSCGSAGLCQRANTVIRPRMRWQQSVRQGWANSAVLGSTRIYLVFWNWGSPVVDPYAEAATLINVFTYYGLTRYASVTDQYSGVLYGTSTSTSAHMPTPILADTWYDNGNPPPTTITNSDLYGEVKRAYDHWNLGSVDRSNAIVFLARPSSDTSMPSGTCAGHWEMPADPPNYVAMPYIDFAYNANRAKGDCYTVNNAAEEQAAVAIHELVEAVTDPYPNTAAGWSDNNGLENADKCQPGIARIQLAPSTVSPSVLAVPQHWSNASSSGAGACRFARSIRSDSFRRKSTTQTLVVRTDSSSTWTDWGGATLVANPAAASWAPARFDVFARDNSNGLKHAWSANSGVTRSWETFAAPSGYTLTLSPAAASWGNSRLDAFVLATHPGKALLRKSYDATGGWTSWTDMTPTDFTPNSSPVAVSWGPSRNDVFILDNGSSPHIRHLWSTDGSTYNSGDDWGAPSGVTLVGDPAVASWGVNRLDVLVLSSGGNLWHKWYDNGATGWDNWGHPSAGTLGGAPAITAMGEGRLRMESALASSGALYQLMYDDAVGTWTSADGSGSTVQGSAMTSW